MDTLKTIQTISLDFYNNNIKMISVKQFDSQSRYLKISCTEQGKATKLNSETMAAFVRYKKPDGYYVLDDCKILEDGTLLFEFTQQMTVVAGKAIADILIIDSSKVTIIKDDVDGFVQFKVWLDANDDDNGNVTLSLDGSNSEDMVITIDNIEDIYNTRLPVLSTMSFYVNIFPTVIDHDKIASSDEYDALIDGLARHVAIEKHMEKLDKTLNENEEQRQKNESGRQGAESNRQKTEELRVNAENLRDIAENGEFDKDGNLIKNGRVQVTSIAIDNCNNATIAANSATEQCKNALESLKAKLIELETELASI